MSREIHIAAVDSVEAGGCNGCTDHIGPGHQYRIWQVTLRAASFRLCDDCLREFKAKIAPSFKVVGNRPEPRLTAASE